MRTRSSDGFRRRLPGHRVPGPRLSGRRPSRGLDTPSTVLALAAWALGGVVLTGQIWLWAWLQGLEKPWWECLVVAMPDLLIWAAIVPLAMWLARRVPVGPEAWARPLGIHLPLAVLAALGATLMHGAIALGLGWIEPGAELLALMRIRIPLHLPTGVALYTAVVLSSQWVVTGASDEARAGSERATPERASALPPGRAGAEDSDDTVTPARRFSVPTTDGLRLVAAQAIDWLEADRNYVVIHSNGSTDRVRSTMGNLERRLPSQFVRIHRSRIVNLDRVEVVRRWRSDWIVELRDGTRLPLSRTYRAAVEKRLRSIR